MTNDNNLLLIILIGIVLFWIFNINTTEKFTNDDSIIKYSKNKKFKKNSFEHYREDHHENTKRHTNVEATRAQSPLLNDNTDNDAELINNLLKEKMSVSNAPKPVASPQTFANEIKRNDSQKILQTPPSNRNTDQSNKMAQDMAKQYSSQQPMSYGDNPAGNPVGNFNEKQNNLGLLDHYMLLPSNSMPDEKFAKVMPKEKRQALTSGQLLPREENKDWFQVPNSKFNLLQAVDLEVPEIKIGVDTVGQSRKNATYDLRAAPPCPKFIVSPWSNSTIEPDYNTKPLC
jgi:hypothetical protein